MELTIYHPPGITFDIQHPPGDPPPPPPPTGSTALESLIASMQPGAWAELTGAADIDSVIAVGNVGTSGHRIPYANSFEYDAANKVMGFVGTDHLTPIGVPGSTALATYSLAAHRWNAMFTFQPGVDPPKQLGSHAYQHTVIVANGDVLLFSVRLEQLPSGPYSISCLFRAARQVDGSYAAFVWECDTPTNFAQQPYIALTTWRGEFRGVRGCVMLHSGNSSTVDAYDPVARKWVWSSPSSLVAGQSGSYHVVSAYSARHNCLWFGGGQNARLAGDPTQMARLNADGTTQRFVMPYGVGIFSNQNLVGDGAGGMLLWGHSKFLALDPSTGVKSELPAPTVPEYGHIVVTPPGGAPVVVGSPGAIVSDPVVSKSVISCALDGLGAALYIDVNHSRSPKARMWVRKAG